MIFKSKNQRFFDFEKVRKNFKIYYFLVKAAAFTTSSSIVFNDATTKSS